MCDNELIMDKLNVLKKQRLQSFSRSINLLCIGFGNIISRKNNKGDTVFVCEYALHIQCPFRVSYKTKILLGDSDLYISSINENDLVDLNNQNVCLLDIKTKNILNDFSDEYVSEVILNEYNDLIINTTNLSISLFVCNQSYESWRFFKVDSDETHVVVDENGLSF